jgi:hypothetical protein
MFFAMSCAQAQQDVGRVSRKHHRRDADVTVLCQYVLDCVGRDLRCVCLIIVSNRTPAVTDARDRDCAGTSACSSMRGREVERDSAIAQSSASLRPECYRRK